MNEDLLPEALPSLSSTVSSSTYKDVIIWNFLHSNITKVSWAFWICGPNDLIYNMQSVKYIYLQTNQCLHSFYLCLQVDSQRTLTVQSICAVRAIATRLKRYDRVLTDLIKQPHRLRINILSSVHSNKCIIKGKILKVHCQPLVIKMNISPDDWIFRCTFAHKFTFI